MAFTSQYYYSHYNLSYESPELKTPAIVGDGTGLAMWREQNLPLFDNGVLSSESGITSALSSISAYKPFPDPLGVSGMALPEFDMGFCCGTTRAKPEVTEFGEVCNGLATNLCLDHYESGNNWAIKKKTIEEPTMKIGKYSVEERKDRILKYLKKRNQRNFNKTIKYACRKTLADKRVRVRGRFAKNNNNDETPSHEGDDINAVTNNNNTQNDGELFYNDDFKIKDDDEDWLHAAMASFMYLPYISG